MNSMVFPIFQRCVEAIREGALIKKVSEKDKEYHFQNWFRDRLYETSSQHGFHFDTPGRNTYPDFRLVEITEGTANYHTLILPSDIEAATDFFEVGELIRTEAEQLIVGYSFDLQTNTLRPETIPNPKAGTEHVFRAWRLKGSPANPVSMRDLQSTDQEADLTEDEDALDE